MLDFLDWERLYDVTPEERLLRWKGETIAVTIPANLWAWLDYFRGERTLEFFASKMLQSAQQSGEPYAMGLVVFTVGLFDRYRETADPDTIFGPENVAEIEQASLYLPTINWSGEARDLPESWWEGYRYRRNRTQTRVIAFEDETRHITLKQYEWDWLDLLSVEKDQSEVLAPYIAHADEDHDAAARALRALAKATFEKGRKAAEPGTIFDPRFSAELDEAAILLGIVAPA